MARIYCDYAATAPLRQCAREAWIEASSAVNPGSQYASGRAANALLSQAREIVAACLNAEPIEVVFTGSGSEADNIAAEGFAASRPELPVACSPVEHPAVREPLARHEQHFFSIDSDGRVDPASFTRVLSQPHAVAACMLANNETGVIQPVEQMVEAASVSATPTHVDAVQVVGHLPVDFAALGCTTLAASAHKFGGPRGCGILLARRAPTPQPIALGGGQQRGLRPGTIDVASAYATAKALEEACTQMEATARRIRVLRARLREGLQQAVDDMVFFTPENGVLPGHLFVGFPGAEGDSLIMLADAAGIECSTGSACSAGVNRASEVLLSMGVEENVARSAVRFTLGRKTTEQEIEGIIAQIPEIVRRARQAGMAF